MTELAVVEPIDRYAVAQRQDSMHNAAVERLGDWAQAAGAAFEVAKGLVETSFVPLAGVRRRLFTAPRAGCPILPPELRSRFTLDESGPLDPAVPPRVQEPPAYGQHSTRLNRRGVAVRKPTAATPIVPLRC